MSAPRLCRPPSSPNLSVPCPVKGVGPLGSELLPVRPAGPSSSIIQGWHSTGRSGIICWDHQGLGLQVLAPFGHSCSEITLTCCIKRYKCTASEELHRAEVAPPSLSLRMCFFFSLEMLHSSYSPKITSSLCLQEKFSLILVLTQSSGSHRCISWYEF